MKKSIGRIPPWKQRVGMFLTSQTISLFGSSLVQYAIIWHITLDTDSGVMVMISTLFSFLPQMAISVFGGVWADRYDRKRLIVLSDGAIALTTLVLAIAFLTGHGSIWLLLTALAMRSLGAGIQTPAVNAFLPQLVPEEKLMRVNGINATLQAVTNLAAPAVGAIVLSMGDLGYVLLIDVATAVAGISIMLCVKGRSRAGHGVPGEDQFQELRAGWRYLLRHRFVKQLLAFFSLFSLLSVPATMLNILFVTRVYDAGYNELALNEVVFSIGMIAGGLLIASWGGFRNRLGTILAGCAAFGLLTIAIGVTKVFAWYLLIIAAVGVCFPLISTPIQTLLQEKVESEYHGRIFSFVYLISGGLMPLGLALFGPLADVIRIDWLMVASGVLSLLLCLATLLCKSFYSEGVTVQEQ